MKQVSLAAAILAAGLMASAQAATVLSENFDSPATLATAGWVFTNASSAAGQTWFPGNSGIFAAQSGGASSYVAANFNSTTSSTGVVDNWLISPEFAAGDPSTLTFYSRASDTDFLDKLEVRFGSGPGTDVAGFSALLGTIGSASVSSYPVGTWTAFSFALPTAPTGRIALRYSVANALDASYIGVDTLSVVSVPEPASMILFGAGLAGVLALVRRRLFAA